MKHHSRVSLPHRLCLTACLFTPFLTLRAQSSEHMTLAQAVNLAQLHSLEAKAALANFEAAKAATRRFASRLRPQVQLSTTLLNFDRGINSITLPDGSQQYVGQSNNQATASLGVSQLVTATGGTLAVTSGLSRTDQFGNFTSQSWQSTPILFSLTQPLFGVRAVDWDRLETAAAYELAERRFAEAHAVVARTVAAQYMALHKAQLALLNAKGNAAVADTLLVLNTSRYQTGAIQVLELTRSELASIRARMAVEEAVLSRDRAASQLALSLGMDDRITFTTEEPTVPDTVRTESDAAFPHATTTVARAQFRADSIAGERRLAEARATSRPSSNLVASLGFNQKGNTLPLAYNSPLGKQRATLGLTIPLVQWGAGAAARDGARYGLLASIEMGRRQIAQAEQDARFAARSVHVAIQQVRLATIADSMANVQFRVARVLYASGNLSYSDFLTVQQEKDNAVLSRAEAVAAYLDNYYNLRLLLGGDPL